MDTKEYILETACKLFFSKNYEAVTMSELTKELKLSKGAIYHHFTNKEEIFKAAVDKYVFRFHDDLRNISEEMKVIEYIEYMLNTLDKTISVADNFDGVIPIKIINFMQEIYAHYPEFKEKDATFNKAYIKKIQNICKNGIEKGEIKKEINPEIMGNIFFSLSTGLVHSMLVFDSLEKAIEMTRIQYYEIYKIIKV